MHAIAELAQAEQNDVVAAAYGGQKLSFGPEYLIPKPFDPRLIDARSRRPWPRPPPKAGVALRPIEDMDAYRDKLQQLRLPLGHH